jgi:hypothetical protein
LRIFPVFAVFVHAMLVVCADHWPSLRSALNLDSGEWPLYQRSNEQIPRDVPEIDRRRTVAQKENEVMTAPTPAEFRDADHREHRSQEDCILELLREAGADGLLNTQIWAIAHAANSRCSSLRGRGYLITCEREGRGVYRYRLLNPPAPVATSPTSERLSAPSSSKTPQELPLFPRIEAER